MVKSQGTFSVPLLESIPGLACVFVGRDVEPRPHQARLTAALAASCPGAEAGIPLVTAKQVHSDRCLLVRSGTEGSAGEGDALLTDAPGIALGVATADCLPLAAVDPDAGALAVVHAGWRGTLSGVLTRALRLMVERLGAVPERIHIGTGAAAGACCYEVGPEVVEAFHGRSPGHEPRIFRRTESGGTHLDLVEANRLQSLEAGVRNENFRALGICTLCRPDICHSYRRDGGEAGRMWLIAALVPRLSPPSS